MLTDEELSDLINDVSLAYTELQKSLPKSESSQNDSDESEVLSKAVPEMEEEMEAPSEEVAAPAEAISEEEAAPAMEAEALEQEAQPAAEEMAAEEPVEEMAEAPVDESEMMDSQEVTPEELQAIYAEMDENEIREHYEAIRMVLEDRWAQEMQSEEQEQPEMEQAPAMEAEPEQVEQQLALSEKETEEVEELAKSEESEEDNETEESLEKALEENEDLKKNLEALTTLVNKFSEIAVTGSPSRKSITEIGLQKNEDNGKSLKDKAKEITKLPLSKSQRETLNGFFRDGANESEVEELVKAVKKA